jgi:hypothetical protein
VISNASGKGIWSVRISYRHAKGYGFRPFERESGNCRLLDALDGDPDFEQEADHAVDDEPCDDLYGEALARARS